MASPVDLYLGYVRKSMIAHPDKAWGNIRFGLNANSLIELMPDKHIAWGWKKLSSEMLKYVADGLRSEDSYVWGNIFAPVEIMQCFGLKTISVETFASFMSGFKVEDLLSDSAAEAGIAPTLCTYHRVFVGALEAGILKSPKYAVTTSLACDGNLCTFRHLNKRQGIPYGLIDIPFEQDQKAVEYVANQLRDLTRELEKRYNRPFSEEKLREIIHNENETRKLIREFLALQATHSYPSEPIGQLWFFLATHLWIGSAELKNLMEKIVADIRTKPAFEGNRVMWIHLVPWYQQSLKEVFTHGAPRQIVACDMQLDVFNDLDEQGNPFEELAKKIIFNSFNGPHDKKVEHALKLAKLTNAQSVIYFNHWGCKEICSGSAYFKEAMEAAGYPTLVLEGDGIDCRNSHDGQIKTRLEAFFEMVEGNQANQQKSDATC